MSNGKGHRPGCVCAFCHGGPLREAPDIDLMADVGQPGIIQLDREQMEYLLRDVGYRLSQRGVAASIYVVGGGALALSYAVAR